MSGSDKIFETYPTNTVAHCSGTTYSSNNAYSIIKGSDTTITEGAIDRKSGRYTVRQVSVGTLLTKTRLANTSLEKLK